MTKFTPSEFTVKELSTIFCLSTKSTIRHLRHLNIPLKTRERFKSHITPELIKQSNKDLFNSMQLTLAGKVKKPFFSIKDLTHMLNKTHSGTYRWLVKNEIPMTMCGNKLIILASTLLSAPSSSN